ncbi:hypothetical protein PMI40_00879 [Herbaspirillum sp. YR522]|nr:hypothetical protein PMI40_00879 [Herbaspirillum sp. YR522]
MTITRFPFQPAPASPSPGTIKAEPAGSGRRRRGIRPGSNAGKVIASLGKAPQRAAALARPGTAKAGSGKQALPAARNPLPTPSLSPTIKPAPTIAAPIHSFSVHTSISRSSSKPSPSGGAPILSVSSHHSQKTFRTSSASQARPPTIKLPDTATEAIQATSQLGATTVANFGTEIGKDMTSKGINQAIKSGTQTVSKAASRITAKGVEKSVKTEARLDSATTGPTIQAGQWPASAAENRAPGQPVVQPARPPGQTEPALDLQAVTRQAARQYLKSQFGLDIDPGQYYLVRFKPSQASDGLAADLRQHGGDDIEQRISLLDLMNQGVGKPASEDMAPAGGRYGIYSQQQIERGGLITADQQDLAAKPARFAPFMPVSTAEVYAGIPHSALNPKLLIDHISRAPGQGGYKVQQAFSDYLSRHQEKIVADLGQSRKLAGVVAAFAAEKAGDITQQEKAGFLRALENGSGTARDGEELDVSPLKFGKYFSSNALRVDWGDRALYYLPGEERPLRAFASEQSAWDEWFGPMLAGPQTGEAFLARQFPVTGLGYREFKQQFKDDYAFEQDPLAPQIEGQEPMRYLVELRLEDMQSEISSSYDRGLRGWD